jgi:hypothetical protein
MGRYSKKNSEFYADFRSEGIIEKKFTKKSQTFFFSKSA